MLPAVPPGPARQHVEGNKTRGAGPELTGRVGSPQDMLALEERVDRKLQAFTESLQQVLDPILQQATTVTELYQQEKGVSEREATNSTGSTDQRAYQASQR